MDIVAVKWPVVFLAGVLFLSCASGTGSSNQAGVKPESANPLLASEPDRLIDDDGVVLLMWEIDDDPSLWEAGSYGLPHLESWRRAIEAIVGVTDPAFLMQRNRELYPWLETEHRERP